jgi:dynein heavy chain
VKLQEITAKKDRANQLASEIKDKDIAVIKSLKKPTKSLEKFTKCLCLLMLKDCHPKPKAKEEPSYFIHAVNNLLSKTEFLKTFKTFKDGKLYTIPKENIDILREETETLNIEKAEFEIAKPDVAFFACREANALYEIINLYKDLYYINIEYIPTKMKADEASTKYRDAQEILNKIRAELAETRKVKQQKEDERVALEAKKEELTKMLEKCKKRLEAGTELVSSLASEKADWRIRKDELKKYSANILGDILISSGIIAYLGAFTKSYRTEIVNAWCKLINEKNIPISKSEPLMIMQNILGDSMEIENWKQKKLPNDTFSVDNALIMEYSSRWPLLIDPQSQAVDFITEFYNPKTEGITLKKNKKTQVISPFHVIRLTFTQREIIQEG